MTIELNKTDVEELRCLGKYLDSGEMVPVKKIRDFLTRLEQKAEVGTSAQPSRKSSGVKEVRKNDYKMRLRRA